MRIALVDDDPIEVEHLSKILFEEFENLNIKMNKTDFFHSGEDFLLEWRSQKYDLIILDIYMNKLSGVEVAKRIRETDNDVKLVFFTASNEFASESYMLNASYYLKKPIVKSDIDSMIKRINAKEYELSRYITLSDGQRLILRDMIYSEYYNHSIHIYTKTENDVHVRITQNIFENLLAEFSFMICCCKGIIVNMYEVLKFDNNTFEMSNGLVVPISRRRAKEVEVIYTDFLFKKVRKELVK